MARIKPGSSGGRSNNFDAERKKFLDERNKLAKEGLATEQALLKVYANTTKFASKQADFERQMQMFRREHLRASKEVSQIQMRIRQETDAVKRNELNTELGQKQTALLKIKEQSDLKVRALQYEASIEYASMRKIVDERADLMRKANESAARSATETVAVFGEGFKDALGDISTGNLIPLAKKMADAFKIAAMKRTIQNEETGGAGLKGMIGGIATTLKSVAAVASIIVGLFAMVKLLLDADKAVKDFNKSLFAGVGSTQIGGNVRDLKDNMEALRKEFVHNVGRLQDMGVKSEEAVAIFHALQEGADGLGLSFNRLGGDATTAAGKIENMMGYVESAVAYSRIFGTSYEEMAGKFGGAIEDMGMGLESIKESFSGINTEAMESGFNVKRFFNQVLQATSGMTMYNLRLEDTAAMLSTLSKTLGSVRANALFSQLKDEQASKGTLDRLGDIIKAGPKGQAKMTAFMKEDMIAQAHIFADIVNKKSESEKKSLIDALGELGKKLDDPKGFAEALGNMRQADIDNIVRQVGYLSPAQGQKLSDLARGAQVFQTDPTKALSALTSSLQAMSPAYSALNKLYIGFGITGKRIDQLNDTEEMLNKAMLESNFVSKEELESLRQLARSTTSLQSEFDRLIDETKNATMANKAAAVEQFNRMNEKSGFVARMDTEGVVGRYRLHRTEKGAVDEEATLADKIEEGFDSLFVAQMTAAKVAAPEVVPRDLAAAEATRDATIAMSDLIENQTNSWLADISETLTSILNMFGDVYRWVTGKDSAEEINSAATGAQKSLDIMKNMAEKTTTPAFEALTKFVKESEEKLKSIQAMTPSEREERNISARDLEHLKSTLDSAKITLKSTNPRQWYKESQVISKQIARAQSVEDVAKANVSVIDGTNSLLGDIKLFAYKQSRIEEALARVGDKSKEGVKAGIKEGNKETQPPTVPVAGVPANDLLLQMGQGGVKFAQRIDNQDVGVFAKKGGALDKAGFGGGSPRGGNTTHNHFYQDQRAIFMSMKKLLRVLGQ